MLTSSRPWQGMTVLGAGILAAAWSWSRDPAFFPDGYELAAAGSCFWGGDGLPALPCEALDLGYTTPLFPFIAGPMGWWLGSTGGVVALSLLCMALIFVPLSRVVRVQGGDLAMVALLGLLITNPELCAWSLVPDERPMALLITAMAWTTLLAPMQTRTAVLAGFLAGLAGWARPEALAVAVLLPAVLLLQDRRAGQVAALSSGVMVLGWLGCQRWLGGSWLPRPYEVAALELLTVLPDDWAKRLVGMGAWSPPVRVWGQVHGMAAPSGSMSPNPMAGVVWVGRALEVGTSPVLWGLSGVGIARALWHTMGRRAVTAVLCMPLPWLIASTLMHARLDELPMANLLMVLLALCAFSAMGIAETVRWLTGWVPPRYGHPIQLGMVVLVAIAVGRTAPPSPIRPGIEHTAVGQAATSWLDEHPGLVVSSYESAPIAFRATQRWQEWPTPFEPERWEGVDWVIRSHLDVMEPISLAPDERHLEAVTGWGSNDGWVRIYRISTE